MSQKSPDSLRKILIRDSNASVRSRVTALNEMENPSRRFLESLLAGDFPETVKRKALRLLSAKLARKPKVESVTLAVQTPDSESVPVPLAPTQEKIEPTFDPDFWKSDPKLGAIFGPDPLPKTREPEPAKPIKTSILKPEGLYD